ncbi:MAG: DUF815 domain-containing protein [Pseudomonadota bacterium]
MSEQDPLKRIADALERLTPDQPKSIDWTAQPAYLWTGDDARIVESLDTTPLATLRGIEAQKQAVSENIARLASGAAAHDMLLWGTRGMGKSALVRAAVQELQAERSDAIALVQLAPGAAASFADLIEQLSNVDRAFLLFLDDLAFGATESQDMLALRSLLDGSVISRPGHIRLAVTSNRRAIVLREEQENAPLHERDERDNALALADRFGLTLGFHPCDRETYLEILTAYTQPLGLAVDEEEALAWAIARGNRSGRTAFQFACELAGRAGQSL